MATRWPRRRGGVSEVGRRAVGFRAALLPRFRILLNRLTVLGQFRSARPAPARRPRHSAMYALLAGIAHPLPPRLIRPVAGDADVPCGPADVAVRQSERGRLSAKDSIGSVGERRARRRSARRWRSPNARSRRGRWSSPRRRSGDSARRPWGRADAAGEERGEAERRDLAGGEPVRGRKRRDVYGDARPCGKLFNRLTIFEWSIRPPTFSPPRTARTWARSHRTWARSAFIPAASCCWPRSPGLSLDPPIRQPDPSGPLNKMTYKLNS